MPHQEIAGLVAVRQETVARPHPNTSSATRGLLSNSLFITSAIACQRSGQGVRPTREQTISTTSGVIPFFSTVDIFMTFYSFELSGKHNIKSGIQKRTFPMFEGIMHGVFSWHVFLSLGVFVLTKHLLP
jgi:hypothetical protein